MITFKKEHILIAYNMLKEENGKNKVINHFQGIYTNIGISYLLNHAKKVTFKANKYNF